MKNIKGWKLTGEVINKLNHWQRYKHSSGGLKVDIWRREPNRWNVTVNGCFLVYKVNQSEAIQKAYKYMEGVAEIYTNRIKEVQI